MIPPSPPLSEVLCDDTGTQAKDKINAIITNVNEGYINASETVKGIVEEGTEAEVIAGTDIGGTGAKLFPALSKLKNVYNFIAKANLWALLQTFEALTSKQVYTTKQTFTLTGANPSQSINLDNGSYISVNLTGASGTATITLTNGKTGASYWIEFLQAATAVNVSLANVGRYDGETGSTITGTNSINFDVIALFTGSGFKINVMEVS